MRSLRRLGAGFGALSVVVLSSCIGTEVTSPDVDTDPSFAISDGANGGSTDFYFLPPLADGNPNPVGDFNPFLLPTMRVCAIDAVGTGGDTACSVDENGDLERPVVQAGALELTVDATNEQYSFSWDTDGPETASYSNDAFLLMEILVRGEVLGWLQLDPQDPTGPGQSDADAYAFRAGETIPVKFWLSTETLCEAVGVGGVEECHTFSVDQTGGSLTLPGGTNLGGPLQLDIDPNSIDGDPNAVITLTLERIDPSLLASGECIPGPGTATFDAPQFGDCFRVTTDGSLLSTSPAEVSICIDVSALGEGEDQLTMVRYNDDDPNAPIWEALPGVPGQCPVSGQALLDVPEDGFFRYAALGINKVAQWVGPEPVSAGDLRFGGLTSSFSTFSHVMPGQMTVPAPVVIQPSDDGVIDVVVNVAGFAVVNGENLSVPGATVHFDAPVGSLSALSDTTDSDGNATVTWNVFDRPDGAPLPDPGDYVLTVSAFGLTQGETPSHGGGGYLISEEFVEFTATVVGPPAQLSPSETAVDPLTAGVPTELEITVYDVNGNAVVGADVTWYCTSTVCSLLDPSDPDPPTGYVTKVTTKTGSDGVATVSWTPITAGESEITFATVLGVDPEAEPGEPNACVLGENCASFTATVNPGAPDALNAMQSATDGLVGSNIDLSIRLEDAYQNPIAGEPVTWTLGSGGGSFASTVSPTQTGGGAAAIWTLGSAPGTNTATVSAGGLPPYTFTATATCFDGWGTANPNGSFGGAEWACADSVRFNANVSGGSTPAVVYWMNDADNLYMAVRIRQSASAKVNDLRIDFDNNGDRAAAVFDDAIGIRSGAFFDEYLTQKCFDRSQSGCGASDTSAGGSTNGAGSVGNDGTWTTFELSHPLNSGDLSTTRPPFAPDFARAATQPLGFFLSLQQGNGAQGNTQWPAFRDYRVITIVGPPASQ